MRPDWPAQLSIWGRLAYLEQIVLGAGLAADTQFCPARALLPWTTPAALLPTHRTTAHGILVVGHITAHPRARQPPLANHKYQIGILTIIDQGIAAPFLESIFDIRNGQLIAPIQVSLEFVTVYRFHIHKPRVVEDFWERGLFSLLLCCGNGWQQQQKQHGHLKTIHAKTSG